MSGNELSRFYVFLATNRDNANEGIIGIGVALPSDARKLHEFPGRQEAEAFAESVAIAFQNAGMIVVYDPDN